ncbi:MAG: heavy metal translocating P-type ATPase [Dokdonella sp.]
MGSCFHCGESVPPDVRLSANVGGDMRPVCCIGCQAAVEWIAGLGLADYYRLREGPAVRATSESGYAEWDRPRLARMHVRILGADRSEAVLLVEGLRCAACAWLIERALTSAPGVHEVGVNAVMRRVRIVFDPQSIRLSDLMQALARLGYAPHPLCAAAIDSLRQRESRIAMKRLAVAGLGTMQAMMYAVALYAGVFDGIDSSVREFFRWMGMLVATPVVLYSASAFFAGAVREWRAHRLSMDTPIAIAIASIYMASAAATMRGSGEVYFDSVSMFVFFLLLGRYVEMRTRHRASDVVDALARLQPATAERRVGERYETVGVHELEIGDRVRVASGSTFPVDGTLVAARCLVDESVLTGESAPRSHLAGDAVIAGSIALDGPVEIVVLRLGADTLLAGIARMVTRAGSARPRLVTIADAAAARFVLRILAITALTAVAWLILDPVRAFASAVSVLVISCPCAFALAAPASLTRAVALLARNGVLVVDANALETLAHVDRFVFDKTGTLTEPRIDIAGISVSRGTPEEALGLAAALEQGSTHPLAQALRVAAVGVELPLASALGITAGGGVFGRIGERELRLGRTTFALGGVGLDDDVLVLADSLGEIARFPVNERLRQEVPATISTLQGEGADCELLSGDHPARVATVAAALGLRAWSARATPTDKLMRIQKLREDGHVVAMIGDGVNDAPVLAAADVAIAIGSGAALAHAASGILLAESGVAGILRARDIARQMLRILQRNLRWTYAYNIVAVPLAAFGLVPPWLAALGMSASSLLVVANSFAIGRVNATRHPIKPHPPVVAIAASGAA